MNTSKFLAFRYFLSKNQDSFIFLIGKLTFLGIFTATFALTLALMVTTGFEKIMKKNLQGLNSDIILMVDSTKKNKIKEIQKKIEFIKKTGFIDNHCSVMIDQIIIKEDDSFYPTTFYGVSETSYSLVSRVEDKIKKIISGMKLNNILLEKMVIIGSKLAKKLNLTVGKAFFIQVPTIKGRRVLLKEQKLYVGAIIETGLEDYDNNVVIGGTELFKSLFSQRETDFFMFKLKQNATPKRVDFNFIKSIFINILHRIGELLCLDIVDSEKIKVNQIKNFFYGYSLFHWSEISPAIISSMKFERFVISLILFLLLFLGLINICSLLFIKIMSKKKDIAILYTLGMSLEDISKIFIKIGCMISLAASFSGIIFANLIGYLIVKIDLIKLPSGYFVQSLPMNFNIDIYIFVFLITNILVLLVTMWPTKRIGQINISQVLRG